MSADFYNTIEKPVAAEFRDRGSKFLACAYPVNDISDFKERLAALKKEHPKATHHCFAYRIGTDGNTYRVSDDGEPSGSAGRPILGQIDSQQLTNVLVVVVRYFGGTLLGVPGLIYAYKTAAAQALQSASIIQKPVLVYFRLQFDYTRMNDVMRLVKQFDGLVNRQEMQLFCDLQVAIPKKMAAGFEQKLNETMGITILPPAENS